MWWAATLILASCCHGFAPSASVIMKAKRQTRLLSTITTPLATNADARLRLPSGRLDPTNYPSLSQLKKAVNPAAFQIDTGKSLGYFFLDLGAIVLSSVALLSLLHSASYLAAPEVLQFLLPVPLQVLSGTALWSMWCIGHDAGHGTISSSKLVNSVIGEIAHSMLCLTPFDPWRRSHKRHHMNHNHLTKDYAHQWFDEAEDLPDWIQAS